MNERKTIFNILTGKTEHHYRDTCEELINASWHDGVNTKTFLTNMCYPVFDHCHIYIGFMNNHDLIKVRKIKR